MTANTTSQASTSTDSPSPSDAPPLPSPLKGDPAMLGIPNVIAGATGLGLVTIGAFPAQQPGRRCRSCRRPPRSACPLPPWGAALGQNITATLYGTILGFYISYVALGLGLRHGWYAIPAASASAAIEIYLICWLVAIGALTITTLRMPSAFTVLFGLVDLALILLLIGTYNGIRGPHQGRRLGSHGLRRRGHLPLLPRHVTGHDGRACQWESRCWAPAEPNPPREGHASVKIDILSSAGGRSSGYLLRHDDAAVLVDCGPGTAVSLARQRMARTARRRHHHA